MSDAAASPPANPQAKPPAGHVTGHFDNRAGERTWIIAWDDGQRRPVIDVLTKGDFRVGQRVRLVGDTLVAEAGAAA